MFDVQCSSRTSSDSFSTITSGPMGTFILLTLVAGHLLGWCFVPQLILQKKPPRVTLAWLFALWFIPVLGVLFYLFVGTDRLRRQRLKRTHYLDRTTDPAPATPTSEHSLLEQLSTLSGNPVVDLCNVKTYAHGTFFFKALTEAIEGAQERILMQFYTWRADARGRQLLGALTDAARRGVRVYLLCDELGSMETRDRFFAPLREAGGCFSWFYTVHPRRNRFFLNLRNHRKITVIDDTLGFLGGMNVGLEYEGKAPDTPEWHDLQVRVAGPMVQQLGHSFIDDWHFATQEELSFPAPERNPFHDGAEGVLVESGPDHQSGRYLMALSLLLHHARKTVDLFTPYFVPPTALLHEIKLCAARGVKVRLMICSRSDIRFLIDVSRSFYRELTDYGVSIYEYGKGVHHSKLVIADDRWISVGSANLDIRSLEVNFEVGMFLDDPETAAALQRHLQPFFDASKRIDPAQLENLPLGRRLREGSFRLLAPML